MQFHHKHQQPEDRVIQAAAPSPSQGHGESSRRPQTLDARRGQIPHYDPSTFSPYEASLRNARSGVIPVKKDVLCGPLLNYRYMEGDRWMGSVLMVTRGDTEVSQASPTLLLRRSIIEDNDSNYTPQMDPYTHVPGALLYSDMSKSFWRFDMQLTVGDTECYWEYTVANVYFLHRKRSLTHSFVLPSRHESMRLMFYSCNGWCDGAEEGEWNHSLWKDVLRRHAKRSFHVMIGGGDQIYNDGIYASGPLKDWTEILDHQDKLRFQCDEELRFECDIWYSENYTRWYNTEPFASALCQIPSLNIWDDHDIIDGYGSYAKATMECSVFRMIGAVAHKYYLLFQHHLPPATYDSPDGHYSPNNTTTPGYILGPKPGPYIPAPSRSIFTRLGARMAFLGVDARTERTIEQVNYPETYDALFEKVHVELDKAARSGRPIKHLILLYGIPLAYPPLTWIEDAFEGFAGTGAINKFDGEIELLDDLNDHYTSHGHREERRRLIERMQLVCGRHSVRATILGGDVHLAAVGRFFTAHKGNIPEIEEDFRFMNNIISSEIVNEPPPAAMAKVVASADKIRCLNPDTEEVLFKLFRSDSHGNRKVPESTHVAMLRRNYSIITENSPNNRGRNEEISKMSWRQFFSKHGHRPLHFGEANAGRQHVAASEEHGKGNQGSLDVCICVEVDHQDTAGRTEEYGFSIPTLVYPPHGDGA